GARGGGGPAAALTGAGGPPDVDRPAADVLGDDDLQLSLYLMYELHYGGLDGADDGWEWDPALIGARGRLEAVIEAAIRSSVATTPGTVTSLPRNLFAMAAADTGPSLAAHVARHATLEQVRELLIMRSPYQLKEGDPQTFAIPRLRGRAKAALVEIQSDEYGGGRLDRMHATLFATTMRALGLDDAPGAYLDQVPAVVLASNNALSLFALHRRLRGALCGHLAAFEMTSSLPAKRWVSGLQRLGLGTDASEFFDEHVEADAVHEQIAAHDLCGALVAAEPRLLDDVVLGAATCLAMDAAVATHTLDAWAAGRSALRTSSTLQRLQDRTSA
ncbi:MAG: iron-containing redox enzyme family protein, partial [Rhodoferax sp.]|nr:iron-containing redox enzyme family protein [Actinomycetota bacterium]